MPHGGLATLGWRLTLLLSLAPARAFNGTAAGSCAVNPALIAADQEGICQQSPSIDPEELRHKSPAMPHTIDKLIRGDWSDLDEDGPALVNALRRKEDLFAFFSHARSTFKEHLVGTFSVLAAWGQPADVRRAGLFHTAFSGDLFQFYVYDAANSTERAELRSSVGEEAEALTWTFGTVYRGRLLGLKSVMDPSVLAPPRPMAAEGESITVPHRLLGEVNMSNAEVAKIIVITLADYLEQMVEVNGWRDHHQVFLPLSLYPGDGKPGLALYWLAPMCRAVREHLEVVPPLFDHCTRTLTYEDERIARDAYWTVVLREGELTAAAQLAMLDEATARNPFVGEPWLFIAQLQFRLGNPRATVKACDEALSRLYAMATAWDKRRSYASWVGFARLLHVRASRAARGLPSLPCRDNMPPTSGGLPLVAIEDVAAEMP